MANYFSCLSCFHHEDVRKEKEDKCPKCGLQYNFTLTEFPKEMDGFEVIKPISRGFYASTYQVKTKERYPQNRVLKVIPKELYRIHNKNIEQESDAHHELCQGTDLIVRLHNYKDIDITYKNNISQECHIQILDFIDGQPLEDVIKHSNIQKTHTITQIIIDLLLILETLKNKNSYHNDLHPGNLIVSYLNQGTQRLEQIDGFIKVVAIDVNATSTTSKSDPKTQRLGDINWIGKIILELTHSLKTRANDSDKDYRIITHLNDIARLLISPVINTRIPNFLELITDIKDSYRQVTDPWNEVLTLKSFDYGYNAQTIKHSHVPALLVDPDNKLLNEVSKPGPLIIHGMRGCGKTLLLKGLTFYSRISNYLHDDFSSNKTDGKIERIKNDKFIGIYMNANRLLDYTGKSASETYKPFEKLYFSYCIESIRVLRALQTLGSNIVDNNFGKNIVEAITKASNFSFSNDTEYINLTVLEEKILETLSKIEKEECEVDIKGNPIFIFENLANAIKKSSDLIRNHTIFFLLDDVSTRYLKEDSIVSLVSTLIFQSDVCAFKLTSEAQTINTVIMSPGNIEKVRVGRDLQTYDMGYEVNQFIRNRKDFVPKILMNRSKYYSVGATINPEELLGDSSLTSIAADIAKTGKKKKEKKSIYHGITMLSKVCVGDIGDIINIYSQMLDKHKDKDALPISIKDQSEIYQSISSNKLFELDRHKHDLKDFAMSFAKASYKLLLDSSNKIPSNGKVRLRQYNLLYVKLSTGDEAKQEKQRNKIKELVDAGIFVYDGTTKSPRTTGNDTDPFSQFKLCFRKLLGLTNFIGISHSDRFELSGNDLQEWLNNPSNEDILIKNKIENIDESNDDDIEPSSINEFAHSSKYAGTLQLFDKIETKSSLTNNDEVLNQILLAKEIVIKKQKLNKSSLKGIKEVVIGIGFEERTSESIKRLLDFTPKLKRIIGIEHGNKDQGEKVIEHLNQASLNEIFSKSKAEEYYPLNKSILIDVSGLNKSMIFYTLINSFRESSHIKILYTDAKMLSPSNDALNTIIQENIDSPTEILKKVTESIEMGEELPYETVSLFKTDTDETKPRALICFSSPKYGRLLHFLDERAFEKIIIINPNQQDNRSKLSRAASRVITDKLPDNVENVDINISNINELIKTLISLYQKYYVQEGCNLEIALTGDKLQTICVAALCSKFKINQCWNIKPKNWKSETFSSGVSESYLYDVDIKE